MYFHAVPFPAPRVGPGTRVRMNRILLVGTGGVGGAILTKAQLASDGLGTALGSFGGEEQKFGDKDWAPADDLTVDDPAAA